MTSLEEPWATLLFICAVVGALSIIGFIGRIAVGLMMWLVDKISGD